VVISVVNLIDKQRVLLKGLHLVQKKLSKQTYIAYKSIDKNVEKFSDIDFTEYHELLEINNKFKEFFGDDWLIAQRLNVNEYKRVKRLKDKMLNSVLSNQAIFLTLTFTDDTIAKTTNLTRRRYVSRYLKSQSNYYIANRDFGATNAREHYHAVVISKKVDYSMWRKYGAINSKRIAPTQTSNVRVSKYVAKLSNHAIKETATQQRLIYSKKML
jgi:hypothetical protein